MTSPLLRRVFLSLAGLGIAFPIAFTLMPARADQAPRRLPEPALELTAGDGPQTATFSGGCFWGIQGVFEHVRGVSRAVSGYTGGGEAGARYGLVSTGMTGHAETVQITYDPAQVSYERLLQILFSVAMDPTELNYQGPDHGSQYRSAIWAATPDQQKEAAAYIAQLGRAKVFAAPIVTTVEPLAHFYPAEDYHQDFLERHPDHPYIQAWDAPKLEALKRYFPENYSETARLTKTNGTGS